MIILVMNRMIVVKAMMMRMVVVLIKRTLVSMQGL